MTEKTDDKRPETFDDLDQDHYRHRPVQVFSLEVHVGRGVLSAAETLLDRLRLVHPDMEIDTSDSTWTVTRPRTDAEKAEALAKAQSDWDERNQRRIVAEQRASLKVGDSLVVEKATTCSVIYHTTPTCSLEYDHLGDHIEVVDGKVAARRPR